MIQHFDMLMPPVRKLCHMFIYCVSRVLFHMPAFSESEAWQTEGLPNSHNLTVDRNIPWREAPYSLGQPNRCAAAPVWNCGWSRVPFNEKSISPRGFLPWPRSQSTKTFYLNFPTYLSRLDSTSLVSLSLSLSYG